ncbi:MAG: DinB family protein [Flavobacteriaceae bacterium]|nr:MAG: DinB family protein [Flavobacteriaceae bacterium]
MHKFILVLSIIISTQSDAQNDLSKTAFLEKWENSQTYLIGIAEAMPATSYDFSPTKRQMSFREQLIHISDNMNWLGNSYFSADKIESLPKTSQKELIILHLKKSFLNVKNAVIATNPIEFSQKVDFFAGEKNKLQILNLLQDHVSHHRGQLIVYLNLKNINPPKYIGW